MPYADPDKRREYNKSQNKDWYERNREHHIAKVRERRREKYGGRCVVCGERTIGSTKNATPPRFCKNHRSEQWDEKLALERGEKVKEAAEGVPKSRKRYVPKITQEKLAQTSHGITFSRLKKGETKKNPPPREWGSS